MVYNKTLPFLFRQWADSIFKQCAASIFRQCAASIYHNVCPLVSPLVQITKKNKKIQNTL